MKRIKTIFLTLLLFLVFAILLVFGLHIYLQQNTSAYLYDDIETVPVQSTVIILGASVHSDGRLSPILKDRVDTALQLYQQKKVSQFLVSGDHKTDDYDEVNTISNYLLARGVPKEKILLDHAGFDTYDSMYRSQAVFGIDKAIVVTQKFHLPRTLFIARNLGLDYTGFVAAPQSFYVGNRVLGREKFANFKAVWEVILKSEPTTLKVRL